MHIWLAKEPTLQTRSVFFCCLLNAHSNCFLCFYSIIISSIYISIILGLFYRCVHLACVCVCARAEKCIFRCKRFPQWREMCNERQCVCWHCNMSSHFLLYGCFWLKWMLAQCTYAMLLLLLQKSVMIVRRTRTHKQHFQFI